MYLTDREKEAVLYCWLMTADGEISQKERRRFNVICEEIGVTSDEKEKITQKCRELKNEGKNTLDTLISFVEGAFYSWTIDESKNRIIWNMVNLGYSDSSYTEDEKEIVEALVKKWNVSAEIYEEFVDISETILALEEQRDWVSMNIPRFSEKEEKERAISEDIKSLLKDAKLTIANN